MQYSYAHRSYPKFRGKYLDCALQEYLPKNDKFPRLDLIHVFLVITRRVISEIVFKLSTTASCGSTVMPNSFSKNVTTLSTAMESRIPVVIRAVVSVNAAGSSPGRYSLRMKFFIEVLISCSFMK